MRRTLALAALAAAACRPRPHLPTPERQQVIEGLTMSQSARGAPEWNLRSRLAVLREDENRADLESPTMDFYRGGRAVSRVVARAGVVDTVTHDVRLSSSVVLDSYEDRSRLATETLLYSSKLGLLRSEDEVTIRRPDGVVHGRGFEAKPDLSEMRIFEQRAVLNGGAP